MKRCKPCADCWPAKNTSHLRYHLEYSIERLYIPYLKLITGPLERLLPKKKILHIDSTIWNGIYSLLEKIGLISRQENPPDNLMFNRSSIFFYEAKKRGLPIKAVVIRNAFADEFEVIINGKKYYYQGIPLTIQQGEQEIDHKHAVKNILRRHSIPIPEGRGFINARRAIEFGLELGFPLVVKPSGGSLSRHVTVNIQNREQLEKAIRLAKEYRPDFIVERYIPGKMFRATVIGREEVFVCQKEPANVIGDGQSTIEQLIQLKNSDPKRGHTNKKNTTLHHIPVDQHLINKLREQNLTLQSVPPAGQKIFLQNKFILSQGCDIINLTKETHPENREIFLRVSKILQSDLIGIDAIFQDMRKPHHVQTMGILETNSLPYIDMHANPSHGEPDPVAEKVWDMVLKKMGVENIT